LTSQFWLRHSVFFENWLPEIDVGRHEAGHERIGAAEHQVLSGRLRVVVRDGEGAWAIPAAERLRILAHRLDVGQVGTGDRRRRC
jgi:hypothetical protein